MKKLAWHALRVIFGAWFLFSGLEYFGPWNLQPLGQTPLSVEFTMAMIHSHLFAVVKVMEVLIGIAVLANRAILPAMLACLPLSAVILWWNLVLDVQNGVTVSFGLLTLGINLMLLWPWRAKLFDLVRWEPVPLP